MLRQDEKAALFRSPVLISRNSALGGHVGRGCQQTKAVNRKNRGLIGISGRPKRRFQTGRRCRNCGFRRRRGCSPARSASSCSGLELIPALFVATPPRRTTGGDLLFLVDLF